MRQLSSPAVREITHLRPPDKVVLACEMHDLRASILGYELVVRDVLGRIDELKQELAEREEVLAAMRDADRELERPWTRRRGRVM